ncbi:MAG: Uncharacterised protein [Rhodospirillaceae bacterium]|nr:MAG: Uncharacterised protein [Rhodospirillaceae bacterium]
MGDVGKRATVDEGWVVFQRLNQIGLHRLLQQHGHRAVSLDIAAVDGGAVAAVGDDDIAQPLLEIIQIGGQAQDRHDFRSNRDVETRLTRETVGHAAQRGHHVAQGAVVHIQHAAPDHPAGVDPLLIAPVDVVLDHRR